MEYKFIKMHPSYEIWIIDPVSSLDDLLNVVVTTFLFLSILALSFSVCILRQAYWESKTPVVATPLLAEGEFSGSTKVAGADL